MSGYANSAYDHNCRWVLKTHSEPGGPKYCEKPVKYKMVLDDDDNRVRYYDSFCPEHQAKFDAQQD